MAVRVEIEGLGQLRRKFRRMGPMARAEAVKQIHDEVRKMESGARALSNAYNKITRIAGRTIDGGYLSDGGSLSGGGGSGLPGKLFYGAEFGGRKRRKTHIGRRGESFYVIKRRRTTMMFLPHLGRRGYFFFPTVRTVQVGQKDRVFDAVRKGVRRA